MRENGARSSRSAARSALLLIVCALAALGSASAAGAGDIGLRQWGPRLGVSDEPDQVFGGVQWNLGELAPGLRFQPGLDIGFGSDHTVLTGTFPVLYRFRKSPEFTPYLGGGVVLSWLDRDTRRGRSGGSDFDIAPVVSAGLEWPLSGGGDLFLQLDLSAGDGQDARLLLGWLLRP